MIKNLLSLLLLISSSLLPAQIYVMSNTTINTCSGTYQDPGGAGNYSDNATFTQTICSNMGNCVSLTFNAFALESGYDFLRVYDGPSTSSPQIPGSPFTGTTNPGTLTCTSGCMTLEFSSDVSITDAGWSATISCGVCPPPPPAPDYSYAWTQKESCPATGRHRGIAISIGNRGYAGLGHVNAITDILYKDWWEYDPGTNSWTQKADFAPGLRMHPTGFSIGNYGYVGTGRDGSGVQQADFYRYDPATNTWTAIPPMPATGRRGAVAFAVGGKGYVGTGSYTSDFYCYDPVMNSWTAIAPYPGGSRISSVAFSIGSKGYVGTGDNGGPTADFWEYDPALNTWTPRAPLAGLPRMEAAGFGLMGYGYIGTGCDYQSGNNYQDFWRFDPVNNTWLQVADYGGVARRYMNCFVINTRAYGIFGTSGTNYNDLWEYGNFNEVNDLDKIAHVKVFPNPFAERLTISVSQDHKINDATLIVFDVHGRKVKELKNISSNEIILDREGLRNGIYFFELLENNATLSTGKFIAQ
jgi:N-acetylneuraminic acid mutarotase